MAGAATPDQTEHVLARLQEAGVDARVTHGRESTVIGAIGERELLATLPLEGYPGVEQVLPILKPYKLVSREISPDPTVIEVRGRRIGDGYSLVDLGSTNGTEVNGQRIQETALMNGDVIGVGTTSITFERRLG